MIKDYRCGQANNFSVNQPLKYKGAVIYQTSDSLHNFPFWNWFTSDISSEVEGLLKKACSATRQSCFKPWLQKVTIAVRLTALRSRGIWLPLSFLVPRKSRLASNRKTSTYVIVYRSSSVVHIKPRWIRSKRGLLCWLLWCGSCLLRSVWSRPAHKVNKFPSLFYQECRNIKTFSCLFAFSRVDVKLICFS